MIEYKINRGMVLVDICGTGALVATKPARKNCPYVIPFNDVAVSFWERMEQNIPFDEIVRSVAAEYEVEETMVRRDLQKFIMDLEERNCVRLV